jgi:hypothetical protein
MPMPLLSGFRVRKTSADLAVIHPDRGAGAKSGPSWIRQRAITKVSIATKTRTIGCPGTGISGAMSRSLALLTSLRLSEWFGGIQLETNQRQTSLVAI